MENKDRFANTIEFPLNGNAGIGKTCLITYRKDLIDKILGRSIYTRVLRGTKNQYPFIKIGKKSILLSRLILGIAGDPDKYADHINGNTLDNRDENLRVCTLKENMRNRKMSRKCTTGFKGAYIHKRTYVKKDGTVVNEVKYIPSISVDKKRFVFGTYKTPEEAAYVYDQVAMQLFGEFARTNFNYDDSTDYIDMKV